MRSALREAVTKLRPGVAAASAGIVIWPEAVQRKVDVRVDTNGVHISHQDWVCVLAAWTRIRCPRGLPFSGKDKVVEVACRRACMRVD